MIVSPLLEMLRDAWKSRVIFFLALIVSLLALSRRSRSMAVLTLSTLVFGFVCHAVCGELHSSWVAGEHAGGFAGFVGNWVVVPAHLARWVPPVSYLGVIAAALVCTHAARGSTARRARADPVPVGIRLGERDAVEAGAGSLHRARVSS